jgi:23S rRNA (guanosine2251-2'-O)-methyltransferase
MLSSKHLLFIGHIMATLISNVTSLCPPFRSRIRFLSTYTNGVCRTIKLNSDLRGVDAFKSPQRWIDRFYHKATQSDNSQALTDDLNPDSLSDAERQVRTAALHSQLSQLGVDAEHLSNAVQKSMTTMEGNDPYYGKSAIKTYRTFLYPRPSKIKTARDENIETAASRCARQIDFLAKRNRSHEAEWVRHTDSEDNSKADEAKKLFPLVILLDNVRSAFNVGSIFRTADACGCSMVVTTGITPSPSGSGREKLAKSALNADRVVPSKHFTTTKDAVEYLRKEHPGFELIGMETTEMSKCYTEESYAGEGSFTENGILPKYGSVLVLGNEVTGVDTEIMPLLDKIVEIPMFGTKNSLNIAACAPVVMYEILRQWGAMDNVK